MWKANLTERELIDNAEIIVYFDLWYESGCIKEVEEQIWSTIQAAQNESYTQMYVQMWQAISKPVLAPSFDEETLNLRGEVMRTVIERTAQFSIKNYLGLNSDCTDNWNFHNSFFFAGTGGRSTQHKCMVQAMKYRDFGARGVKGVCRS